MRRLMYVLRYRVIQSIRCRLGRHDCFDICNHDASVTHSTCLHCMQQQPPLRPREANAALAKELADAKQAVDEYLGREA